MARLLAFMYGVFLISWPLLRVFLIIGLVAASIALVLTFLGEELRVPLICSGAGCALLAVGLLLRTTKL